MITTTQKHLNLWSNMNKSSLDPVSIIVPIRNASTTLSQSLQSLLIQSYPIAEIIIVDNVSSDNSVEISKGFRKKTKIPIKLIRQKRDKSVSSSFNLGVSLARSPLVILFASDCVLPTKFELTRLVAPMKMHPEVVATYPTIEMPMSIWNRYNFWEKYFAARMVGVNHPEMVLKFDCVRRDVFNKLGGFDDINFGGDADIGGEDAEFNSRLCMEGEMIKSSARAVHLHYMADNYSLIDMMKSRKKYARSYARFLLTVGIKHPVASLMFLIRPTLCVLPFVPYIHLLGISFLVMYAFLYTKIMFVSSRTNTDYRIVTVPFLNIFFLYFELFWMVEAAVTVQKRMMVRKKSISSV